MTNVDYNMQASISEMRVVVVLELDNENIFQKASILIFGKWWFCFYIISTLKVIDFL